MSENGERFKSVVESTAALAIARFAIPILITVVGAAGTYILHGLNSTVIDVRTENETRIGEIRQGIMKLNETTSATHDTVIELKNQGENVKGVLQDHEGRIRILEHVH